MRAWTGAGIVSGDSEWRRRSRLALILAGLLVLLVACGAPAGARIVADGVWARPAAVMAGASAGSATPGAVGTPGGGMDMGIAGPTSAIYLTIRNEGRDPDRLVAVSTEVARAAELHETRMDGGVMRMGPVSGLDVPAGGRAELKPGGHHVMLIGLQRELKVGERFPVTLQFERGGAVTVQAEVRPS